MRVDVENTPQKVGDQYMKLLIPHFLQKQKFPTPDFLEICKNPKEPQLLPSEVKVALKKCLQNKDYLRKQ